MINFQAGNHLESMNEYCVHNSIQKNKKIHTAKE